MKALTARAAMALTMFGLAATASAATGPDAIGRCGVVKPNPRGWGSVIRPNPYGAVQPSSRSWGVVTAKTNEYRVLRPSPPRW